VASVLEVQAGACRHRRVSIRRVFCDGEVEFTLAINSYSKGCRHLF
jgi:hypothetical protein